MAETSTQDGAEQVESSQQAAPPDEQQRVVRAQPSVRDYFRWRPLPWWMCFLGGTFLLTKLQLVYNDSPCAVLGTQSPVGLSDVKKAFRTLSMCTHPDRLRGRLKRTPTQAESRRGEIIFNRASAAKDDMTRMLKGSTSKKVPCYQGELEFALLHGLAQVGRALTELGVGDWTAIFTDFVWKLVTFDAGFFNTLLSVLWLAFLFRILKQFLVYLWRMGIIRGTVAVVTTVVIGPLPTLVHFVVCPVLRPIAFARAAMHASRTDGDAPAPLPAAPPTAAAAEATVTEKEEAVDASPPTYTAGLAAAKASGRELPQRNIRQRKKKETDEEKDRRNKELLTGGAEGAAAAAAHFSGPGPMPESLWSCITWACREPLKARMAAASAVQFDLLLLLTKPIIPLFMLIAMGQVWNGLFSSLFIGHALRRWVPQMSYEAHHLLCSFFGAVHTLLGVSAQQVEDYANREGKKVLHLAWSWSFKDVMSVMHMCLLGSTVTAIAGMGNEPSFAASFSSGIALRIALAQDSIRGLGLARQAAVWMEAGLRDLGVVIDAAEEVVSYSGHGIGDCGGGPFRMLFGDGPQAQWAAFALKAWLMLMPALAAAQWLQRSIQASRMLGKKWKLTRLVQRVILFLLATAQCILLADLELNASNGALGNFWVAMLFGCVGESLLCTYDIRGPVRQIVFLVLFLLI